MITKLAADLRAGKMTARALAEAALARISARKEVTNAFITATADMALAAADDADRRIRAGEAPWLCGIPVALKDNLTVAGVPATAASRMLFDFVPPYSAAVWEKIAADGGVLVGKTNLDEFAMGAGGETSAFGAVRNPHAPDFVAGGSSAGSAAAVADGQAVYALGSDTGGSIRVPAAYCGVVGLKPTYGRISRRGLIAFASSLDTVGILSATVRDAAIVFDAIAGPDAGDMTSLARTDSLGDFLSRMEQGVNGMRVGVVQNLIDLAPAVGAAYDRAARALEKCGAQCTKITFPSAKDCYTAYYLIASAEASSNLSRYDGIRYGYAAPGTSYMEEMRRARRAFGDEVKRRILAGAFALSHDGREDYYDRACRSRAAVTASLLNQFARCDVILLPTVPDTAYRIGEKSGDPVPYRTSDALCTPASLAGLPAISVPAGRAGDLPIGMQLIAPAMGEAVLFAAAAALEEGMRE